jgi:2-methylisocitrate lyase-like PEP mutase family enzyme
VIDHSRAEFRQAVESGRTLFVPFCPDALTARLIETLDFDAGYVSGAGLGFSLALTEALLSSRDLADVAVAIRRRSELPLIVDGGVGFGDAIHVQRSVWDFEAAGVHAIEFEDQVSPKRASHHRHIEHLVPTEVMAAKIRFAIEARRDPNLLIIARTGGLQNESLEDTVRRGEAYRAAGADVVMMLANKPEELAFVTERLDCPTATLAYFDDHSRAEWRAFGLSLVVDPQTGHAVSFAAMANAYEQQAAGLHSGLDAATLDRARGYFANLTGLDELYDVERATTEPNT